MDYDTTNNGNPWSAVSNMFDFNDMKKQVEDYLKRYKKALKSIPKHPSRKESLDEAARLMESLGFQPDTIREFRKNGGISYAMENGRRLPLSESDGIQIQKLEKQGNVVYAAIRNDTNFGRMTAYIIVSKYGEDWILERENSKRNYLLAYVYNHDLPCCSEMGIVEIKCLPDGIFDRIV